ncbi:hypothetical protein C8R45DRAFT_849752, partial [Mycena sanguinolenta]
CPPNAPPWFVEAREQMTAVTLGCHFDALVAVWTRLEDASRFEQGPTNLPHRGRPRQVTNWIASGRGKRSYNAAIGSVGDYAGTWQNWWNSLQPRWREKADDGKWRTDKYGEEGREWGPLYQWGVNGTLSIVASLYFWGVVIGRGGHPEPDVRIWEESVNDVNWMMEGMAAYYELFGKKF